MPSQARFTINGLIDTNQPVLQNLDMICTSAGAWFTFDNNTGNWSVVINKAGNSVASFDNSNIISGITVNGTGLRDAYNGVKVVYPRADIKNNQDFIQIELPESEWNASEVENMLEMTLPLVDNQVQAQLIGFRELKQSRINKMIQFETDYTAFGLKAGDIIDVTNSILGLSAQKYRITTITESDDADRGLTFAITTVLYSDDVYNEDDLSEYIISDENGLISVGDIGIPGTPEVTIYAKDSRPRVEIETTAPSGIVEGMEFWMAVGNSTGTYTLVGTEYPQGNGVFNQGDTVTLDLDNINAGNLYFKTRGFNSTTAGPFSAVGNLIPFVPVQTTDAINNDTILLDQNGNQLATFLGLASLLKYVDTGVNNGSITNTSNGVSNDVAVYSYNLTNITPVPNPDSTNLNHVTVGNTIAFTVSTAGWYLGDMYTNWGGPSGNITDKKYIRYFIATGNVNGAGTPVPDSGEGTSSYGDDVFDDLDCHGLDYLTPGNYHLELYYGSANATFVGIQMQFRRVNAPIVGVYNGPA